MKPGQPSQTAVLVCMGRAAAHGRSVTEFADPTALELLPADARARVERFRAGERAPSARGRIQDAVLERRSKMMVARTVAIDEAIRDAANPQVVILGAGLDGRAWRMSELEKVTVFEVDHPDTQREKRARATALAPAAREIRFVPVDFARDDLGRALAEAGHDPARPSTWIWEGVVMYLEARDIEATLAVVARRSPPKSRLVVSYSSPAVILPLVNLVMSRLGEPFRSIHEPDAMRALLAKHAFSVIRDESAREIGARLSPELARAIKVIRHMRVATADRVADT